ncbi:MAG TPA: hypothetical protein VK861_00580 [Bacteroidales bacterium]|nr:hypothetical protein [Bacteroidales bacterium]
MYSEPVREIMGNPPGRMTRWGTTILAAVFLLFILLSLIIRYPDNIPAPVEITTTNPPVPIVSKITGHIRILFIGDRAEVTPGQLLAVMETAASINEIEQLKKTIDTLGKPELLLPENMPLLSELGEIQNYWASFQKSVSDYNIYIGNDLYGNKIEALSDEIKALADYILNVRVKEKLFYNNSQLEEKKYRRDSVLYAGGVLSESDLERSQQSLLRINIELQQARLDRSAKMMEMAEKKQLLQDFTIRRTEEREKLTSVMNESLLNLRASLRIWENTYLLVSPVTGTVTFTRFWSENQAVIRDEVVMSVVPAEAGDFVGRINLKMQRSGKVEPGQTVNIKLSGYPYLEYGMVRGRVKSKSLVPSGDAYVIEIELPDGLVTLYGIPLDFTQNMQGTAEIITSSMSLFQKIVNPFRYMITRNRI